MTESFTDKMQILEHLATQQKAVNLMLEGGEMVVRGGISGIKFAAEQQPELLLDSIHALVTVIKMQQQELVEAYEIAFSLSDAIDDAIAEIEKDQ